MVTIIDTVYTVVHAQGAKFPCRDKLGFPFDLMTHNRERSMVFSLSIKKDSRLEGITPARRDPVSDYIDVAACRI